MKHSAGGYLRRFFITGEGFLPIGSITERFRDMILELLLRWPDAS